MKKIFASSLVLIALFGISANNAGAQTNQSETGSAGYSAALMKILLDQIEAAVDAISNTQTPVWVNPPVDPVPTNTGSATTPNITTTCGSFTTDMRLGDSGTKVINLTKFLVKEDLLTQEYSLFNNTVFQAVVAYQEKYASVILAPVGLSRGTGFVGPATRAHMNSRLGCTPSTIGNNTPNNIPVITPSINVPPTSNVGTGSGNAVTLPTSGGPVKVLVLNSNPNNPDTLSTLVPISDYKISPKAGIFIYGSVTEEWNGWAKVSANGVDYPVAGPGSSIVINGQTFSPCTSCQNHDALNLMHITVPNLPIPDGTDVTIKLFKNLPIGADSVTTTGGITSMTLPEIDTSKGSYSIPQTFKYYRNPQIPASDPYILPDASPNQPYNQLLVAKIGSGSVSWMPRVIAGVLPRGFDVNSTSITYDPAKVYVKPNIGDMGLFIMWGTVGGQDIAQKFKLNMKSVASDTPVISSVVPSSVKSSSIGGGVDIIVNGKNFVANNLKIGFKGSNGLTTNAPSFSVLSGTNIKVRVPSLPLGSYTIEIISGGNIVLPLDGSPLNQTFNVTQ